VFAINKKQKGLIAIRVFCKILFLGEKRTRA